jgi:hypothetical protein
MQPSRPKRREIRTRGRGRVFEIKGQVVDRRPDMTRRARLGIALLLLIPLLGSGRLPEDRITYRGTVRSFNERTGDLVLLTGVGMALRLVPIRASAATRGPVGRARSAGAALRRGDVLRVDCRVSGGALVAERIERAEAR